jgi:glycosyltransferase involved in cell wall biosynthesis
MIAGYYPPDIKGGGEISTQVLAEILTDAGCQVQVLTCGSEERTETVNGISVHRIVSPNLFWDFNSRRSKIEKIAWHLLDNVNPRARNRVSEFLHGIEPDLLLTSTIENFGAEAWVAAHQAGIPSVHILRSYYPFCYRGNAVRKTNNCSGQCLDCGLLSLGRRRASRHVSGIVGISRYILSRHERQGFFVSSSKVVIGEPISNRLFRQRSNFAKPYRFGYLGILSEDKGLESLAKAWNHAGLSGRSLSIAGKGKEDYVLRIKNIFGPDVSFEGWVDSSNYLSELDYLVVPSIWNEPFGRIVIEAFAKGVPVIGSRIGGIAETIVDGRNGYTFRPSVSDDLAELLVRCSQMPIEEYQELSRCARLDAEQFEAALIAKEHIEFYRKVILAKRAKPFRLFRAFTNIAQRTLGSSAQ